MSLISQKQLEKYRELDLKKWYDRRLSVGGYFTGLQDIRMRAVKTYASIEDERVRKVVKPICMGILGNVDVYDAAAFLFEMVARRKDVPAKELYQELHKTKRCRLDDEVYDIGGKLMKRILTE